MYDVVCVCVQGEVLGYHSQAECRRRGLNHYELLKMMKTHGEEFSTVCNNNDEEDDEFDGEDLDFNDEDGEDSDNCCECSTVNI